MKYNYKVIKNEDVSDEEFDMAFNCAITSIESILYDYDVKVIANKPDITIFQNNKNKTNPISPELILLAFIDAYGKYYDEFKTLAIKK